MESNHSSHVAIVYPGGYETRKNATPDNNRLASIFKALSDKGIHAEPAVYHDDFHDEVKKQLMKVQVVLVWMNPIQDGRDRSVLDPILREIAEAGIFVSTHPDVILKMGTKEVLYRTREIGWGCDTHLYRLPVLWDGDFLFGPKEASGENSYVLCEINASSIAPYPESAPPLIAQAVRARLNAPGN